MDLKSITCDTIHNGVNRIIKIMNFFLIFNLWRISAVFMGNWIKQDVNRMFSIRNPLFSNDRIWWPLMALWPSMTTNLTGKYQKKTNYFEKNQSKSIVDNRVNFGNEATKFCVMKTPMHLQPEFHSNALVISMVICSLPRLVIQIFCRIISLKA